MPPALAEVTKKSSDAALAKIIAVIILF